MSYARQTTVSPEKSRTEIELLLRKYGASEFGNAWSSGGRAMIQFRACDRLIRFELTLPNVSDPRFRPKRCRRGLAQVAAQEKLRDQEVRRMWRALALVVKAKLEAVSSGITTFESEFLAHIVLPDGRTVGDYAAPAISEAYASGRVRGLLPASRAGEE